MKKRYFMFCIFFIFISCKNNNTSFNALIENKNLVKISFENIPDNPCMDVDSLLDSIYYIKPQATNRSLISEYSKILIEDKKVFIMENSLTNKAVYAFDIDGQFLFNINAKGNGPGEYNSIHDFYVDIDNKQIGILDRSQILKYDFNGRFINRLDLRKYLIKNIILKNNYIYAYTYSQCFSSKCHNLKVFNMQGELVYADYPLSKNLLNFPIGGEKIYLNSNLDNVYFNSLNNDTIYKLGIDHITPELVVDFGNYKYPDYKFLQLVKNEQNAISELSNLRNSKYIMFGINNFSFTKDYFFMSFSMNKTMYYSLYSFKTKNTLIFSSIKLSNNFLITPNIISTNNHIIYCTLEPEYLDWYRKHEESLGILNPKNGFPKNRVDRYNNLLKNINLEDNKVIAIMKFKPF